MTLRDLKVDPYWSLFLDRDGVINRRIVDGYVKTWEELGFLPGVIEAFQVFSQRFGAIVVVSNQQVVGKGLMTAADVEHIHERMKQEITMAGGRADAFYFAPQLSGDRSIMRKPGIGMALKARKDFPQIRFRYSIMAGDSVSDMIFGKRTGMVTVLIADNPDLARKYPELIDFRCSGLDELARQI